MLKKQIPLENSSISESEPLQRSTIQAGAFANGIRSRDDSCSRPNSALMAPILLCAGIGLFERRLSPDGEKVTGEVKIKSEHLFHDLLGKGVEIPLETPPLCQKSARSLENM